MYVIFTSSKSSMWWTKLTRKDFGHVFVVDSICADYFWLIIDPIQTHTDTFTIPKSIEPTIEGLVGNECIIVECNPIIDINATCFTLSLNTCVDTVKRILGIRSAFIITPYQLYNKLTRGIQDGR